MFLAMYQIKSASSVNDNGFEFDQNTLSLMFSERRNLSIQIKAGSSRKRKFSYSFFSNKDETQLGIR